MKDDTVRRLEALVLEIDDVEVPAEDEQQHDAGRSAA